MTVKNTADPILHRLDFDLDWARRRLIAAEKAIARARRAVELRERERAEYVVTGIVPKRKKVRKVAEQELKAATQQRGIASRFVNRKGDA